MEYFAKIINGFQPLTFFAKDSTLDFWVDSEEAYEHCSQVIMEPAAKGNKSVKGKT